MKHLTYYFLLDKIGKYLLEVEVSAEWGEKCFIFTGNSPSTRIGEIWAGQTLYEYGAVMGIVSCDTT